MSKLSEIFNNSLVNLFGSKPIVYNAETKPSIDAQKFALAIGENETGGVKGDRYKYTRYSGDKNLGNALGKYQVTEGELKTYGPRYMKRAITSKEFLSNPSLQDEYIQNKALHLANQGYQPEDIADIHRMGITKSYPAGSGNYQSPGYVEAFKKNYNLK